MRYVCVDIEADGPIPGDYSMISLGAIVVDDTYTVVDDWYGTFCPISPQFSSDALSVSGFTRGETLRFPHAATTTRELHEWLSTHKQQDRLLCVTDNAGFDWMFLCWYLHHFEGSNPLGYSCFSLTSFYKGYEKNMRASFKHLRKTPHSHNALDDAIGNAEALITLMRQM